MHSLPLPSWAGCAAAGHVAGLQAAEVPPPVASRAHLGEQVVHHVRANVVVDLVEDACSGEGGGQERGRAGLACTKSFPLCSPKRSPTAVQLSAACRPAACRPACTHPAVPCTHRSRGQWWRGRRGSSSTPRCGTRAPPPRGRWGRGGAGRSPRPATPQTSSLWGVRRGGRAQGRG